MDATVSKPVALAVLVQAAVSRAIVAAAQVAGCGGRQGREPGRTVCADMGCSFALGIGAVQRGRAWRTQAWAAIWTASQGLPRGGV
jgi:hypothetical protein